MRCFSLIEVFRTLGQLRLRESKSSLAPFSPWEARSECGSARILNAVAQIFNPPHRRISFCGPSSSSGALDISDALPIANRRYGRLQTCATYAGSWAIPALLISLVLFTQTASAQSSRVRPLALSENQFKSGSLTLRAFAPATAAVRSSIVKISQSEKTVALGTIIDANGLAITKASEIKEGLLSCKLADGREIGAKLLGVDEENDVALIKISASGLKPVEWASGDTVVGQWAVTPGIEMTPEAVGIISVPTRKLHKRAYMGVVLDSNTSQAKIGQIMKGLGAEKAGLKPGDTILIVNDTRIKDSEELMTMLRQFREGDTIKLNVSRDDEEFDVSVLMMSEPPPLAGLQLESDSSEAKIRTITPNSGAEKAGLKSGDVILSLNGKPAEDRAGLLEMLRRTLVGETVSLRVKREEKEFDASVKITSESPGQSRGFGRGGRGGRGGLDRMERMNRMGGELSQRAEGFDLAIQHDTVLQPWQCGGPLVNLEGKAIGLNIARAGRVATYALPSELVKHIVEAWLSP